VWVLAGADEVMPAVDRAVAMAVDVGRIGVWCSSRIWPQDAGVVAESAAELEELGYQALWLGMSPAGNLEQPEALLAATSRLAVATGIVSVWDAPPTAVAAGAFT
jgi:alkanesulfonate monooxygenase SsuD/methylene tetrahydromethanopterin reductase-like flavin-dependent oxidoreductase (luciferase family)